VTLGAKWFDDIPTETFFSQQFDRFIPENVRGVEEHVPNDCTPLVSFNRIASEKYALQHHRLGRLAA
jgi:hypothetical protein